MFFKDLKLVDVEPHKVVPTWINSRRGRVGITKQLDRFLVDENILEK
jgi:hypothetical protein